MNTTPLDLGRLKVRPLAERDSLTRVEDILIAPDAPPAPCPQPVLDQIRQCAAQLVEKRSFPLKFRYILLEQFLPPRPKNADLSVYRREHKP